MIYVLVGVALLGHIAICVTTINRMHGTGWPRWFLSCLDWVWMAFAAGLPTLVGLAFFRSLIADNSLLDTSWFRLFASTYVPITCIAALIGTIVVYRRATCDETTPRLVANHTVVVDLTERLGHEPVGDLPTRWLARIPGNEILKLSIHEKQVRLPRLPRELEGFHIAHLSDLHFTGQMSRSFYEEIVRETNAMHPDLIAITGDIIDKVRYLEWVPDTLAKLRAPLGVYFVLGNHELRIRDIVAVRRCLTEAGLVDLGSTWKTLDYANHPLVIAGNELPWHRPATDLSNAPAAINNKTPFKILLAHTPDQLSWARRHNFDLMLAGHTHGGQVRLPWLGPILAPSLNGVRHASGTFYLEPTLLHVSRGLAGTKPLRYNCPPELAKLTLYAEERREASGER
jgi:predicted MPP superfamily phosphohydrolase